MGSYKQIPAGAVLQYLKDNYEGKEVLDSRSPAGNWLHFTLEKIEKGTATISLEVKEEMTQSLRQYTWRHDGAGDG